jgi:hypothetical protein
MSETSPPKPMMEVSAKVRRRLTSVKRAREPYDAGWEVRTVERERKFRELTKIVRGDYDAIFEFDT